MHVFELKKGVFLKCVDIITFNKECDIQYREHIMYYPC